MTFPGIRATSRTGLCAALTLSTCLSWDSAAASRYVERIAGVGVCGSGAPGNGGPALEACLGLPVGIAVDSSGVVYVAEVLRGAIRRIDPASAEIDQIAAAPLAAPGAIALDGSGGLFVATTGEARIRRIELATGAVTHVAGNGSTAHCGDGGAATSACIGTPAALAVRSGQLYLADSTNDRVRRVDLASGVISTLAGNGANLPDRACPALGDGASATTACLSMPAGLAVDSNQNVYVADNGNHRIRRVLASTGVIETFAGTGDRVPCDESLPAEASCIPYPGALAIDSTDAVYVTEAFVLPPGLGGPVEVPLLFPGTALLVKITVPTAPAERVTGTLPCTGNPEGLPAEMDCSTVGFGMAVDSTGEDIVYSGWLDNVVRKISTVADVPLPAVFRSGRVPPTPRISEAERHTDRLARDLGRQLGRCFAQGVRSFLRGKVVGCNAAIHVCASDASCPLGQACSTGEIPGFCECSSNDECPAGYSCDRHGGLFSGLALCTRGCSVSACVARSQDRAIRAFESSGVPSCAVDALANGAYLATLRNPLLWCDGAQPLPAEFTSGRPGGFFPATTTAARATLRLSGLADRLAADVRACFEHGVAVVDVGLPADVANCLTRAEARFLRRAQGVRGLPACSDPALLAAMILEQEGERNGSLYCE